MRFLEAGYELAGEYDLSLGFDDIDLASLPTNRRLKPQEGVRWRLSAALA